MDFFPWHRSTTLTGNTMASIPSMPTTRKSPHVTAAAGKSPHTPLSFKFKSVRSATPSRLQFIPSCATAQWHQRWQGQLPSGGRERLPSLLSLLCGGGVGVGGGGEGVLGSGRDQDAKKPSSSSHCCHRLCPLHPRICCGKRSRPPRSTMIPSSFSRRQALDTV